MAELPNEREEMALLAAAADAMDDGEVPVIPDEPVETVAAPQAEPEPAAPDLSGGLDGGEVDDSSELPRELDALLGIGKEKPVETPVEEASAEPEEASAEQARIKELSERLSRAEDQRDKLAMKALERPVEPQTPEEPQTPLDSDVEDYMDRYIGAYLTKHGMAPEDIKRDMAPMKDQIEEGRWADAIGTRIPGFTREHMPALKVAFTKLDPETADFEFYNSGVAGATELARDLMSSGALDVGPKKKATPSSPLAARHHSEAGTTPSADGDSEVEKAKAIMAMSDETFRRDVLGRMGLD